MVSTISNRRSGWLAIIPFAAGAMIIGVSNAAEVAAMQPSYATVVDHLHNASVPVRELGDTSKVAITLAAGRVVAMAFSADGPNLLWSNPKLSDTNLVKNRPQDLVGGIGGDRLWFAPELEYNWDGKPDWATFANYKTPAATDPGAYQFGQHDARTVALRATGELPVHGADRRVGFAVDRSVRLVEPPLPKSHALMTGVDYVGIESSHSLKIADATREGTIDLWHLLQAPVGSTLIVPLKKDARSAQRKPLSYGMPGTWVEKVDHVMWRFGGEARAKLGLPAAALTGRTAIFRELQPGRWCMIVREFTVDPSAKYGDHPHNVPRTDQAFQAWDGFGFGEMEFHSPIADAQHGPRELTESDRLWAFGGSPKAISALATELLKVDVGYLFVR